MSHSPTRRILIQKGPNGLGFSVKGGGDVGIPLIVSRVEAGGGAVGLLKVGMEISAVNGISLEGLPHYAAVEVLRRTRSPVILFVRNSTNETVAIVENCLSGRGARHSLGYAECSGTLRNTGGTLRSTNSRSEYDTEYKLYYGPNPEETEMNVSRLANPDSNVDLYDLRTVKRFVKEILHQPKEIFAKKLAWQFPPVALGKFHKWLLTKLQRFDCEVPANTANYIYDAFSQSLYLSRAIYDLVHLIRTLMAMERTSKSDLVLVDHGNMASAVQPATSAEFNNPQVMASFLSELTEIRAQLARAKEHEARSPKVDVTQAHINQQNAEIRALREQLGNYEARIADLTTNNTSTVHKETDLGSFFKEGFKKIKNKTLKRRASLSQNKGPEKCSKPAVYLPSEKERAKENCPNNDGPITREKVTRDKQLTSTPRPGSKQQDVPDSHNEIFIQMGEEVQAHTLQVKSDEDLVLARTRIYSSDDDYVQMNGVSSPALPKTSPVEEEVVIRRTSRDFKRSSVSSSQSKASIESLKLKRKQTIRIDSSGELHNESSDYIHMSNAESESETDYVQPETQTDYLQPETETYDAQNDMDTDYVHADTLSLSCLATNELAAKHASVSSNSTEVAEDEKEEVPDEEKPVEEKEIVADVETQNMSFEEENVTGDEEQKVSEEDLNSQEEEELKSQDGDRLEDAIGSDTISTSTVKAEVNVVAERQMNAAQVREISRDVDSIMVDVETLHRLEQDLKKKPAKPALFPKPKLYKANSSTIANSVPHTDSAVTSQQVMTSPPPPGGGMVKAHEVPIYAKVDRILSPPAPRIRPFSFGETSNCSFTSQNELSRHDVCSKTSVRKTSLTSNGSSIELKSEYSYDRPSSYNTSHTASTEQGDRFSRVSSDIIADEERLSVLSDNKSDSVFSPIKLPLDPLTTTASGAPEKPPRSSPPLHSTPGEARPRVTQVSNTSNVSVNEPRNKSMSGSLNVSFDENCLHKEVGEDFFNQGKQKKRTPFKKIMSFGKGKKKRSNPSSGEKSCSTLPRQPDILQPTRADRRASSEEFQHSKHFSVHREPGRDQRSGSLCSPQRPPSVTSPLRSGSLSSPRCNNSRSRDNSGASSSTGYSANSRHSTHSSGHSGDGNVGDSTRNSGVSSVHSGELMISPISVSPIGELDREVETADTRPTSRPHEIGNDTNTLVDSNKISPIDEKKYNSLFDTDSPNRRPSKGFYGDLGIKINFDDIPVKSEKVLDLTNETIIDLDGDIIKDPDELRVLRAGHDTIRHDKNRLSAKVDNELRIHNDCNKMVREIERLSAVTSPSMARVKREETPSPTFSDIDILMSNISKDLDNFNI